MYLFRPFRTPLLACLIVSALCMLALITSGALVGIACFCMMLLSLICWGISAVAVVVIALRKTSGFSAGERGWAIFLHFFLLLLMQAPAGLIILGGMAQAGI